VRRERVLVERTRADPEFIRGPLIRYPTVESPSQQRTTEILVRHPRRWGTAHGWLIVPEVTQKR